MKRIRTLRTAKGLSLKQLGHILGVAESTVSLYETGKRQPDHAILLKLADFFQVSTDYLLERTDDATAPASNIKKAASLEAGSLKDQFMILLLESGLIEKEEDITPEQARLLKETLQATLKLLKS